MELVMGDSAFCNGCPCLNGGSEYLMHGGISVEISVEIRQCKLGVLPSPSDPSGSLKFGGSCKLGAAASPRPPWWLKNQRAAATSEIPGGARLIHVRRAYP